MPPGAVACRRRAADASPARHVLAGLAAKAAARPATGISVVQRIKTESESVAKDLLHEEYANLFDDWDDEIDGIATRPWSYNGKLVFTSNRQNDGGIKLWSMSPDGSNQTQLTFESEREVVRRALHWIEENEASALFDLKSAI